MLKCVIDYNSFVCPCTQSFCLIFIKKFQVVFTCDTNADTKFEVSAVICFWVLLITDTHTHICRHADHPLNTLFSDSGWERV